MPDPAAQGAYYAALFTRGIPVILQRPVGFAPAVTYSSTVALNAFVLNVTPDGGADNANLSAAPQGAITQNDRLVIVMAKDLTNSGFTLPVVKGDQIVLPDSSEILNIVRVDPYKRAFAGAIEFLCAGVS